jgi:hypothetical protein
VCIPEFTISRCPPGISTFKEVALSRGIIQGRGNPKESKYHRNPIQNGHFSTSYE